jgi:hypothetical protein
LLKCVGFLILATILWVSLLLSGCSGNSQPGKPDFETAIVQAPHRGSSGTIMLGKAAAAASAKVPESGGTISITETNSPIQGLKIVIPSGSYSGTRNFEISYAAVEKHTFGEAFNPVTPLITIENGGGYAGEIMEVTLPLQPQPDSFTMGFLYDAKTGTLEGLPVLAIDGSSITLGVRHFSNVILSMIPKSGLQKDIETNFQPGRDDWQFVNRGSFIAQSGHGSGQSLSALWYYLTQPDGKEGALYNRYDNNGNQPATADFWQDDSLGYRFASTIQNDINCEGFTLKLWQRQREINDELTWNLLAYAMQLTGEPQVVGLTKGGSGGLAMIGYRVKDGQIYIADPNYPGNRERQITYADGKFKPYESGANFEDIEEGNSFNFETISYTGETALIDWDKITQRWAEFKNQTIGNDRFPAYTIVYEDAKGQFPELTDGYVSANKAIYIGIKIAIEAGIIIYRDGVELARDANGDIELKPGTNNLGIYAAKKLDNGRITFIDFKYLNAVLGK